MYLTPAYFNTMKNPLRLEIIIRGDGFPIGGGHACFLLAALGNCEEMSKCLSFNFPINIAAISEKNRERVRQAFAANLAKLNMWSHLGQMELLGLIINVKVEWGGDEAWMRMMLGLQSSSADLACFKCLWLRPLEKEFGPEIR